MLQDIQDSVLSIAITNNTPGSCFIITEMIEKRMARFCRKPKAIVKERQQRNRVNLAFQSLLLSTIQEQPLEDEKSHSKQFCDLQIFEEVDMDDSSLYITENSEEEFDFFDSDNESHAGGYLSEDSDCVESFDLDVLEEESILTNEQIVTSKLQTWSEESDIPFVHVDTLLKLLNQDAGLSYLPLTARTLMNTMRAKINLRTVFPGKYFHYGIAKYVLSFLSKLPKREIPNKVMLVINIDGIPLTKISGSQFWPILCSVYESEGLMFKNNVIPVFVHALICDSPARAFVTSVKGHNAYHGCPKCVTKGVNSFTVVGKQGVFARHLWLEDEKMADDRFETNSQEKEVSILIGVDQMFEIIPNEPAIQSLCGLRAYNTKLGRMIAGPSKEKRSEKEKAIIQQMLQCSSFSNYQTVSSYAARCLDSEFYFTNPSEDMEVMEAGKEAEEFSPAQPRPMEEISSQELNNTSKNKKEKRKIVKEELKRQTDFDLSLFWKLEHFAILDDCDAVESDDALSSFGDKITRQKDGRYCTPIPWKMDKWRLEKNFLMAKGRLESLLERLKRTPELLSAYHNEIDQLHVQNSDKKTTKIRPVFDGAAKSKYGVSLNDVLETGPNINPDLLAVLMRFRLNKIAWIADIEKAFLNIALHPEDAEAIRFLWITEPKTPNSPLVAYKWKRVPFGLSSSPVLLQITLNKHLDGME
ncbi:Uncharacterized protein APZ42_031268 [Daphnia magna]|uniref:Uncharacterized protein n=1 Tax=Daphnia magna TaxID=35525 RepID=A0A164MZM0_9CRUS|nr:Uncharacterized protein APZ42_031268 [Daphnia magna]